jgi:hypothetical protein
MTWVRRRGPWEGAKTPDRVRARVLRSKRDGLLWISFFLALFLVGCILAVTALYAEARWGGFGSFVGMAKGLFLLLAAAFTGSVAAIGVTVAVQLVLANARIIPYFSKPLTDRYDRDFSLKGGVALARLLSLLDEAATAGRVRPLSDFGFADDQYGEVVRWHDASSALQTVTFLLSSGPADAADDLKTLSLALRDAADAGAGVSLLVRTGEDSWQGLCGHDRVGGFW